MVIKSYQCLATLSLALFLELAMSTSLPGTAISPSPRQQEPALSGGEVVAQRRSRLRFKVPNIRPTGNLEGGAARGNCSTEKIEIKALLPNTNIGLTTAQKPTFFFQISKTSAQEAKFSLLNPNTKESVLIYEKNFPLTGTGGVMSFTLPADAPALEVGKEYHWEVALVCNPDDGDQGGKTRVQGAITRVQPSPTFASQLQAASPRDRVALYAQEGYWHDALKALADLRSANPNDPSLVSDWTDLLSSNDLNTSAQ